MNVETNNNIKCTIALATLENVIDPEIGLNVVDLGLIYQIDFDELSKTLMCIMTLTTQYCPMGESIRSGVIQALQGVFPEYKPEVELSFNPEWSYEMISESGKKFLEL